MHTAATEAAGMIRVPLDLCGPAFIASHEQSLREAAEVHGGGEIERLPRQHCFGLAQVGQNLAMRQARACSSARQRERCGHYLQEAAPADFFRPLRSAGSKLIFLTGRYRGWS